MIRCANPRSFQSRLLGWLGALMVLLLLGATPAAAQDLNVYVGGTGGTLVPDNNGGTPPNGTVAFGSTTVGTSVTVTLTFDNPPNTALTVSSIGVSGTEFSANKSNFTIAKKGFTTVDFTFSPTATGTFTRLVTVANNSSTVSKQSYTFQVTGTGTAPPPNIVQPTTPVTFPTTAVGSTNDQTIDVSYTNLTGTLNTAFTGTDAASFTVFGTPTQQSGNGTTGTQRFTVRFTPTASTTSTKTATLTFSSTGATSRAVTLNATQPALLSATTVTAFGNTAIGSTSAAKTSTVTYQNLSVTPSFTLGGANPGDFNVTAGTATGTLANGNRPYNITFSPTATGARAATLTFTSTGANSITINLSGTGTAAAVPIASVTGPTNVAIADNSGSYTFDSTPQNRPVGKVFTITNNGTQNLTVGTVTFIADAGTAANEFIISVQPAATVAAGASTQFVVRFTARTLGSQSGRVSFATNDGPRNPYDFAVSGTTTTASNFGTLPGGNSQTFVQTNGETQVLGIGDWYSAAGTPNAQPKFHYIRITVPTDWPVGREVNVDILSPEMNANFRASGAITGDDEPDGSNVTNILRTTSFELYRAPSTPMMQYYPDSTSSTATPNFGVAAGASILKRHYAPISVINALNSAQATDFRRFVTIPAATVERGKTYVLRVQARGDNNNAWRLRVGYDDDTDPTNTPPTGFSNPDNVNGTNDEIIIGINRSAFQQDTGVDQLQSFFTFIQPGRGSVQFNNFDMDNGTASVKYTSPTGTQFNGDPSGNAVWNNPTGTETANRNGDVITNPQPGVWKLDLNISNHNQYIVEVEGGEPIFFAQPPTPVVTLSKTNNRTVLVSGNTTYTVSFANTSTGATAGAAVNAVVTDLLPTGATFVSGSFGPGYTGTITQGTSGGRNTAIFTINEVLVAGASGTVSVTVNTAQATGTFTNDVQIAFKDAQGNVYPTVQASDTDNSNANGLSISGTVFEDVNYGGGLGRSLITSGGIVRSGATVELYSVANGTLVASTTTAANGVYTFTNVTANASYNIRVVNSTVTSSRAGSVPGLLPVQTFRTEGTTSTTNATGLTDRVGGEVPSKVDAPANSGTQTIVQLWSQTPATNDTTESVARVQLVASDRSGFDFGYNFDTVVNTSDAGQGSLRQFILNSNALGGENLLVQSGLRKDSTNASVALPAGRESSIFMIPNGVETLGLRAGLVNQLTNGVALLQPVTALPTITGPSTIIDGTTESANIVSSTVNGTDTNPGFVGVNTAVGVGTDGRTGGGDDPTLLQVPKPEVEIRDAGGLNGLRVGLSVQANNVTLRGLSVTGFGNNADNNADADILIGAFSGATVELNVIGSQAAAGFVDPDGGVATGTTRTNGSGIRVVGATAPTIQQNLIGFSTGPGIALVSTTTNAIITNNQIQTNGINNPTLDGLTVNGSTGSSIYRNLFSANQGSGIDLQTGADFTVVRNNTVTDNGRGTGPAAGVSVIGETAGLRVGSTGNTVEQNVFSLNYGAGVMVLNGVVATVISRNSIFGNGTVLDNRNTANSATNQVGIDLLGQSTAETTGTGPTRGVTPFYTLNDLNDPDGGANNLLNFPVFESVTYNPTLQSVRIVGLARPGATIELFLASTLANDQPGGFAEGRTYIGSFVEGNSDPNDQLRDRDATTGSYNNASGTDNTNRFQFDFYLPAGVTFDASTPVTATATLGSGTGRFTSEFSRVLAPAQDNALPVELTSFEAKNVGNSVELSWITASERDNKGFLVERRLVSTDANATFSTVGSFTKSPELVGKGSGGGEYRFVDRTIVGGTTYEYRLVDISLSGERIEHQTIRVETISLPKQFALHSAAPNPFNPTTQLRFDLPEASRVTIRVYNTLGQTVKTVADGVEMTAGANRQVTFDAAGLPTGAYMVRVEAVGTVSGSRDLKVQRVMLVR